MGYTTDYTTLAKEFGVGLQREAVSFFDFFDFWRVNKQLISVGIGS